MDVEFGIIAKDKDANVIENWCPCALNPKFTPVTGKETQFVIIVDATTRSIVKLYVKNLELFTAAEEFELKMVYTYLQIGDNIDSNEIAVTVKITEPECIPVNYRFDPEPSDLTFDQLLS